MAFKKSFLILSLAIFISLGFSTFISGQRPLEVDYPEVAGFKPGVITQDLLPKFVKYIFDFSVGLAGLIAVAVLIYAGFRYFMSAGNPAIQSYAKQRIAEALLGLGIILGSYLILTTVNPQLTFLDLKIQKTVLNPEPTKPAEQKTLLAEEIPIGYLMANVIDDFKDKEKIEEGLYSGKRFKRISDIYEELVDRAGRLAIFAKELKSLSESLKKMTDSCNCGITASVASYCTFDSCPLKERPFCQGDPCFPNRPAIESLNIQIQETRKSIFVLLYQGAGDKIKIDEATKKIYFGEDKLGQLELEGILNNENETEAGFIYWQQRLDFEIKDFERISGVFLSAQNKINSCSGFQGLQDGKPAALLNRYDFERWREITNSAAKYEKVELKGWQNARPQSDAATFYCSQQEFGAIPANLPGQDVVKEIAPANLENPDVSCKLEITLGDMFDSSNDLAKKILTELQNLYQKIQTISNSTAGVLGIKNLEEEIDAIQAYGCNSGCRPWKEPWEVCWEEANPDPEGPPIKKCNRGEDKCCVIGNPPKGLKGDGMSPGCSLYQPVFLCNGTPGLKEISAPQSNIEGFSSQFTNLFGIIKNEAENMEKTIIPNLEKLFLEKDKDNFTQPEKRIEELKKNRQNLADPFCSTPKSGWESFLAGETIIEQSFYSAKEVESTGWVKTITNKNNFYCCKSKASVPK